MRINQPVVTPYGEGVFQGVFDVLKRESTVIDETVALVRLKVTEQTLPHLHDANCLTPHACESGLWTFKESELS